MKKRIMSMNMNSMGGKTDHLMNHRYFNNRDQQYHIDWQYWAKNVDKADSWEKFKAYILEKKPSILIIEEMLVSCYESINFIGELKEMGYFYLEESLPEKGNWSLTMTFFRDGNPEYIRSPGNYRENRNVVCQDDNLLICGSHFPYESDEEFLKHMREFVMKHLNLDLLLIGDLNANDPDRGNKKLVNDLLDQGAVDLWTAAGNDENTPTEAKYQGRLDYAIASPSLAEKIKSIEIDPFPMDAGITDHAAVIVDIEDARNKPQQGDVMAIERDDGFYLSLSLNEQMLWLYEEIEQSIKTNQEHEVRQCDAQDSCRESRIDRLFRIVKEDPKNRALLREIERAEREWRNYVDHALDAPSADEILTYWKQYMWAFCAECDGRSRLLYFLMRGYDMFHDADEWIGMYDSIWKLKAAYQKAVRELEEEHREYGAREWTVTHERVMIHAFDQTENRWKYDIPYETLFPEHENALPQGVKIPQFLKTEEG